MRFRLLLLGAALVVFSVNDAYTQQAATKKESSSNTLSSLNGRYVFGRVGDIREDTFMLDTQTGRLWVLTRDEKSRQFVLSPVLYQSFGNGDFTLIPSAASADDVWRKSDSVKDEK